MIFQFGTIADPFSKLNPALAGTQCGSWLLTLSNNLLKTAIVLAGLYAFWNFIAAGYGFMSAGDDAKAVGKSFAKFTQSLLGLLFVAGALVLAAVFGYLIFGDARTIISPTIYGPGACGTSNNLNTGGSGGREQPSGPNSGGDGRQQPDRNTGDGRSMEDQ